MLQYANLKHLSKKNAIILPGIDIICWCCSIIKGIIRTADFPGQDIPDFLDCAAWFPHYLSSIPCRDLDRNFSGLQQCTGKLGSDSSQ